MNRTLTFGRTLVLGFAVLVTLTIAMAAIALIGLNHVVDRKDEVIDTDAPLVLDVQKLLSIRDARAAANRGFLISGQQRYLDQQYHQDDLFARQLSEIRAHADTARARNLVDQVAALQAGFVTLDRAPVQLRQDGASAQAVTAAWERIDAERENTDQAVDGLFSYQQSVVETRKRRASDAAKFDTKLIVAVLIVIVLAAVSLAVVLTRRLRRRIATAVGEVQLSSAELQTTATQQAVGAKEQATTINEISTSTTELLASSRQIAESAQQVTDSAGQTTTAGLAGRNTMVTAQESMTQIRGQVDTIVNRVLELGEKSQRIGVILDIVSELAEQTNILAINSTIEAAGAGQSGRRFAVVADEIRKLADRVSQSTKDIRDLIDGTRTAVNATVMAIEIGSKAVDAGSEQVETLASSLEQILTCVQITTDAAREIELSTRQQSLAVEQVNLAIANVAQATRDTEMSSGQTLQTASQLKKLSTNLQELVEAGTRP
jgi:methyl-accepting chemotaxis protein